MSSSSPHSDLDVVRGVLNAGVPAGFSTALEALDRLEEQLEAARSFLVNINEDTDEALLRMRIDRALEYLGSNPALRPSE